jgi:hypothetical protein
MIVQAINFAYEYPGAKGGNRGVVVALCDFF